VQKLFISLVTNSNIKILTMRKLFLLFIFQLIVLITVAQSVNPFWQNYTSRKWVTAISFLGDTAWVTSEGGISIIVPGTGLLKNYNTINSELPANNLENLVCTRNNGLWFTRFSHAPLYHVKDYDMSDPSKWEVVSNSVGFYGIAANRNDDILYFGVDSSTTPLQFKLYRTNGISTTSYDSLDGYFIDTPSSQIISDFDKNVWILMHNKLFKENATGSFDFIDSTLVDESYDARIDISPDSTVWALIDSPVRLAKLTDTGWVYYDSTSYGIDSLYSTRALKCDNNGNVWALCAQRYSTYFLLKFDGSNWTTYDSISAPMLNDRVQKIEIAPNGNLWFISGSNGAYEFDGLNWLQYDAGVSSFPRSYVKEIDFESNGDAWLLAMGRLYKKSDTTFINYGFPGYDLVVDTNDIPWITRDYNYPSGPIFSYFDGLNWHDSGPAFIDGSSVIACDRNNVKWIGSSEYGLIKFTDSVETIFSEDNSPLASNFIHDLYCDSKENVWINTGYSIQKLDGNSWTTWPLLTPNFLMETVDGFSEDKLGNIWVWDLGSSGQTVIAKYDGQTWTAFNPPAGLPNRNISSIAFDHNNTMWVRFFNLGIGKFDGTSWTMITPDNSPLPYLSHGQMKFDRFDNLFIYDSYEGLTIFNPNGIQYDIPVPTSQRVTGQIFHDVNSNAVFDSTESGMSNQPLLLLPDSIIITTNSIGKFVQNLFAGDYEIQVLPFPGWNVTTDSLSYHIRVDSSSIALPDFGLNAPPFHAVEITQNTGMLYCGHDTRIWINYTNTGSVTDSGEVILKFDTIAQYNGGVPTALQFDDSVAVWNFSGLMPFETRTITSEMLLAYRPNLIFSSSSEVNLKEDTAIVASDIAYISDSVHCYDDEITALLNAYPIGTGSQHIVNVTDTMYYTIRFQNTTHDSISYLSIVDTLDLNFDLASFRIIASSHYMNYSFNNNLLTFSFHAINLPDSSVDFLDSQGFITFSVIPKNTTPHLTIVENSAQVSYDYSAFVQTNEVFNTIYQNGIGIDEISGSSLQIYPNPAGNVLNVIYSEKVNEGIVIVITDMLGRKVVEHQLLNNQNQINLSALKNGFYIVSVKDKKAGNIISKRLIVQR